MRKQLFALLLAGILAVGTAAVPVHAQELSTADNTDTYNVNTDNADTDNIDTNNIDADSIDAKTTETTGNSDEENAPGDDIFTDNIIYINPLYRDVIHKDDLNELSETGIAAYSEPVYETNENILISQLLTAMINRQETVTLYYQTPQEYNPNWLGNWFTKALAESNDSHGGDYMRWSYGGYEAKISYRKSGNWQYTYTLALTYYTTAAQEAELDRKLTTVLNSLGVKGTSLSNVEKTERIYDYICANVTYDYANLNNDAYNLKYTAYAALINRTAVCQGYATLLYRMQEEAGIDTRVITGIGNGGPHAWNLTQLGAKYYLSDSTWDAGQKAAGYRYFLKGTSDFGDHAEDADSNILGSYPVSASNYLKITALSLNSASLNLEKGSSAALSATVMPESILSGEAIQWSTSNSKVAAVDAAGKVTAIGSGTAVITASIGGRSASCNVTVTVCTKGHTYKTTITKATTSKNGSITTACTVCGAKKSSTVIYYPRTITLSGSKYSYNGKTRTPSVKVTGSNGKAIPSSAYTVSYAKGRKNVDRYNVKISFRGNYSGTVTKAFDILPKSISISKVTPAKKGFTVKWKAQKQQVTGYQIQYSTVKSFKKSVKSKTVAKYKTASVKIAKQKAKKTYYVRIRTYKTVKINGKSTKLYSGWSTIKAVKTK